MARPHLPPSAADARGRLLLRLAREAIARALSPGLPGVGAARSALPEPDRGAEPTAAWLREPGATFVTLTRGGELRGCIGSIEARRPLIDDLRANARSAALADPRFTPVTAAELPEIVVEVSVLSPPEPLPAASEEEAIAALRPGLDGVIFDSGSHQSTFLPQVWSRLSDPREFLAQLKQKAGLPRHAWPSGTRLRSYRVVKWSEVDPCRQP